MMVSKVAKTSIAKQKTKQRQETVFQLKISLVGAPLPIWRRIVIRADLPLALVHEIFQITMGWWHYHLYDFEAKERHFGNIETADGDSRIEDDTKFTLKNLVTKPGDHFMYRYDFGDGWEHDVLLEDVIHTAETGLATCIMGKRACPPEDVGGIGGYKDFLDAIEDPLAVDRIEKLEWAGGAFEPDSFDQRGVNLRLILLQQALAEL